MRTTVLSAALTLLWPLAQAQQHQPAETEPGRHVIKQDSASVGSNIKRNLLTSRVPLNKRYAELTPQERQMVKSQYEGMAETDEPPFPAEGLGGLYKTLAQAQQKLLVSGDLVVHVDVDSQGKGISATVVQSPDPEMGRFAASLLMLEKYKPAVCNGEPCKGQFPLSIHFEKRL